MSDYCLPCPCCGGYARARAGKQYKMMVQDWHDPDEALYQPCTVICTECRLSITREACNADFGGASGAAKEARRRVIAAWNNRYHP